MEEIARVVKKAALSTETFGISVATLYSALVKHCSNEGKKADQKAKEIAKKNKAELPDCIHGIRVRKMINHIRTNDLIPGLIATSKGYFIAETEEELLEYEQSLKGREDAIREVRISIARQRRILYEQKRAE